MSNAARAGAVACGLVQQPSIPAMTDTLADSPADTSADSRQATWEKYVSAWKEDSASRKAALLADCAAPGCVYQDPLAVAHGHESLVGYMLDFQRQVPGGHFVTTAFRSHHDASLAQWDMVGGDGTVLGHGTSVGRYDERGLLVAMTGFFDVPAPR